MTDLRGVPGDSDRYRAELQFINWSEKDAHGILLVLNEGTTGLSGMAPFVSNAQVDADGRPMAPTAACPSGACPPTGTASTTNLWVVNQQSNTRVRYSSNVMGVPVDAPIGHPTVDHLGTTYDGLLDPDLSLDPAICRSVIPQMIPGSVLVAGMPNCVIVPDPETLDDGSHSRDGFVIEIDDWDNGEQVSFNWWLLASDGSLIGELDAMGQLVGDAFGFGTLNLSLLDPAAGTTTPPAPLFDFNSVDPDKVNTGYDPPTATDDDADSPLLFAEDEVGGIDGYPVNPIPAGLAGAGISFHVEPGAAISAAAVNQEDMPPGVGSNVATSPPGAGPCEDVVLTGDPGFASLSGDAQTLALDAGIKFQGRTYLVLGSVSGTDPGVPVPGTSLILNLNPDSYFQLTLNNPFGPPIQKAFGTLDALGRATASFALPPGVNPSVAGFDFDHAYVVFDQGFTPTCVSNPVAVDVVP